MASVCEVRDVSPDTTLLDWLRRSGRVGTKCGCAEGDCGACTVALCDTDAHGPTRVARDQQLHRAAADGRRPRDRDGRRRRERRGAAPGAGGMVKHYGSQCGYCTPGFVMSMFEGYYRDDLHERCADRRSALRQSLPLHRLPADPRRGAGSVRAADDATTAFRARLRDGGRRSTPFAYDEWRAKHSSARTSLAELFALNAQHPEAVLVAGATEIGVLINKRNSRFPGARSRPKALPSCARSPATADAWHIGAAATLTAIEEALGDEFPTLAKMLRVFARGRSATARRSAAISSRRRRSATARRCCSRSTPRSCSRRRRASARVPLERVLHRLSQDGAASRAK